MEVDVDVGEEVSMLQDDSFVKIQQAAHNRAGKNIKGKFDMN